MRALGRGNRNARGLWLLLLLLTFFLPNNVYAGVSRPKIDFVSGCRPINERVGSSERIIQPMYDDVRALENISPSQGEIYRSSLFADAEQSCALFPRKIVAADFSRLRRAVDGQHHHVSKHYLHQYANEAAWREDHRRTANGGQHAAVLASALHSPVSRAWKGYWQRVA